MEKNCLINVIFLKKCIYINIVNNRERKLYGRYNFFINLNYIVNNGIDIAYRKKNKFCFLFEKFLKWGII